MLAAIPLLDQGSVQFILFGVTVIAIFVTLVFTTGK